MRLIILLFSLLFVHSASAGWSEGVEAGEGDVLLHCERLLTPTDTAKFDRRLDKIFLGRPYMIWTVHDMTDKGMEKMGLDPRSTARALEDLVLIVERSTDKKNLIVKLNRWANGGFKTIQRFEFTQPKLVGYRALWVTDENVKLDFAKLSALHPEDEDHDDLWVGYQTEPDADGVRRYISFGEHGSSSDSVSTSITFGLDVPPNWKDAEKYSEDLAEVTDDLRTPTRNWRRIGVLSFARLDIVRSGDD